MTTPKHATADWRAQPTLGRRIRARYLARGFTCGSFADALCVRHETVHGWDADDHTPSQRHMRQIASLLDVDFDTLKNGARHPLARDGEVDASGRRRTLAQHLMEECSAATGLDVRVVIVPEQTEDEQTEDEQTEDEWANHPRKPPRLLTIRPVRPSHLQRKRG